MSVNFPFYGCIQTKSPLGARTATTPCLQCGRRPCHTRTCPLSWPDLLPFRVRVLFLPCRSLHSQPALVASFSRSHRFREIEADFRTRSSWRASWVESGAPHGEILGSTIGIVGLGRVGQEVARRAAAFGCHVIAANRSPRRAEGSVEQVYPLSELDRMLPVCDFVVLCTALGPETEGLIDARRLALMKPSAFLINIARGMVVEEDAVYTALRDRRIGGAALDVWWQYPNAAEPERRPSRHPFHELPNVIMTPHCSGWTVGMVARRWAEVAGNINRFVRGEPLENVVVRT